MPETEPPPPRHHRQPLVPSRLGMRGASSGGEIVEVQGGHIVRSTGRKDRHSKVCTAKGPRDRRVRLSAHTAIQFYDVQDRLGYDRPSKAVDWLINKARAAIDELAELPPWNPTAVVVERERENNNLLGHENNQFGENSNSNSNSNCNNVNNNNNSHGGNSGFLPPSMDSDSISDTIKSFFPMNSDHNSGSSDYPTQFHSQDLRLSLQSFDNPIFSLHHAPPAAAATHHHHHHHQQQQPDQTLLGYDHGSSGWADFQRMVGYYSGGAGGGGDSLSYTPAAAPLVFGNHQFVTQRGPLQSSNNNTQSIRAWIDPPQPQPMVFGDHLSYNPQVNQFSGFRVPARIRGDEEEHDGVSDKPSSASSDSLSRH